MHPKELHDKIASLGIRIFKIRLNHNEETFLVHDCKTTAEWREDLRNFLFSSKSIAARPLFKDEEGDVVGGYASDDIYNGLSNYMLELGYHELDDVISDVFEGRITNELARLVDDPCHEEQKDGFGHYGWESKKDQVG